MVDSSALASSTVVSDTAATEETTKAPGASNRPIPAAIRARTRTSAPPLEPLLLDSDGMSTGAPVGLLISRRSLPPKGRRSPGNHGRYDEDRAFGVLPFDFRLLAPSVSCWEARPRRPPRRPEAYPQHDSHGVGHDRDGLVVGEHLQHDGMVAVGRNIELAHTSGDTGRRTADRTASEFLTMSPTVAWPTTA